MTLISGCSTPSEVEIYHRDLVVVNEQHISTMGRYPIIIYQEFANECFVRLHAANDLDLE